MKKIIALLFACVLFFTGCTANPEAPTRSPLEAAQVTKETITLFDTSTVKIVLDGSKTTVTDKTSGIEHIYTTTRKLTTAPPTLEQLQARCIARTSTSSDTLEIELAGALIVVHDFAGNQTYYIQH